MNKELDVKGKKRLVIDLDVEVHTEIKKRAVLRHCSMKQYIEEAIAGRIVREDMIDKAVK